ncbi:ABC transporter ATP-binding protein [Candidatus Thorarchaeota archaeon]|nr:MAG: ABC transporter ATP-binding protein [Candidatus Thorarchaeota archaeon]
MLETQDLTFSYDGSTQILQSLHLQIHRGELLLITGPTGSGKSTLAKCLAGFIPRSIEGFFSGLIKIDGKNTEDLSIAEFSKRISLVQQDSDSQICTLRVSDEIAFGPENFEFDEKTIETLVNSSLSDVKSLHLSRRTPHTLSGGEKQRIAIAAMLSCQSDFIILDEPSSSLDPKGIVQLRNILSTLKEKNVGIICIEHNLGAVSPIANRTLFLNNGILSKVPEKTPLDLIMSKEIHLLADQKPLLSLERICFSYEDTPIIKNVDFGITSGEIVALMGGNGSGKTTLVSLLGGLVAPNNGTITLCGVPISKLKPKDITKQLSVVFQNPNHQIFESTVWKEQMLTSEILEMTDGDHMEFSRHLLDTAELLHLSERNPFSLSHGQKRRLNITSTTGHRPHILLLDEPFVGQDYDGRQFILNTILDIVKNGGTALIVTHDMNFAKNCCTRIVFLENGSILLDGSPETVIQRLSEIGHEEYTIQGVEA